MRNSDKNYIYGDTMNRFHYFCWYKTGIYENEIFFSSYERLWNRADFIYASNYWFRHDFIFTTWLSIFLLYRFTTGKPDMYIHEILRSKHITVKWIKEKCTNVLYYAFQMKEQRNENCCEMFKSCFPG